MNRLPINYGLVASDIDETILKVEVPVPGEKMEENLIDSQALKLLIELFVKGFHFAAVTHNDGNKFFDRFVFPLKESLDKIGKLELMANFTAYTDGTSQRYTFDKIGTEHRDTGYSHGNEIPESERKTITTIMSEAIEIFHDRFPNKEILFKDYDPGTWCYDWPPPIRVRERGDGAMLVLKPLPGEKHLLPNCGKIEADTKSIRLESKEYIEKRVREEIADADSKYQIACGGWSSIDVTQARINKATAIKYELDVKGLNPADCLYFGNEVQEGGNDYPVAREIPGIHVVAVNQKREDIDPNLLNVFYGGHRGCLSACHQFSKLLEAFENMTYIHERNSSISVPPAIHWMIMRFLEHAIINRFNQIDRSHPDYLRFLDSLQQSLVSHFGISVRHSFHKKKLYLFPDM